VHKYSTDFDSCQFCVLPLFLQQGAELVGIMRQYLYV